ncbi:MAG: sensor histidine kinase [Betaproteobacteria bacterium]
MSRVRPFRLVPRGEGGDLVRRASIVAGVAVIIALVNWLSTAGPRRFDISLVYSMSISLMTWFMTDFIRYPLREVLNARPPSYWPPLGYALGMLVVGILVGYVAGTAIGDAYAGVSTLELLRVNAGRFAGFVVGSMAVSLAFIGFFYQRGRGEALARQAKEAQLALLQSQLEPHMLFNTLANLRVLIGLDAVRAQAMLDRLIGYLRATLDASRKPEHPLRDEFARVADYLALIEIRMGARLKTRLELPEELRERPVPPLLLQPLVENAIKHGLEPKVEGGIIEVMARLDDRCLVLTVRDTGLGLNRSPDSGSTRFGLEQVRQRLLTRYGGQAALHLEDAEGGGVRARIVLPTEDT